MKSNLNIPLPRDERGTVKERIGSAWVAKAAPFALAAAILAAVLPSAFCATGDYADKLERAPFFDRPLLWTGSTPPDEAESERLWNVLGGDNPLKRGDLVRPVESFIKNHPQSPWTPSLQCSLAKYFNDSGYFSMALSNWTEVWAETKELKEENSRIVADCALASRLRLLSSLGRAQEIKELLDETQGRKIYGAFRSQYFQAMRSYSHMANHPQDSYLCGPFALKAMWQAMRGKDVPPAITAQSATDLGFSMATLEELARSNGLDLVCVGRPGGGELVVPSIVHWKENHYAAIVEQKDGLYRVVDPTFSMSKWLTPEAINHEASGNFLVPANQTPSTWERLDASQAGSIFGKGYPADMYIPPPQTCSAPPGTGGTGPFGGGGPGGGVPGSGPGGRPPGAGGLIVSAGCSTCGSSGPGMASWSVTEPNIALCVDDEPLTYQPATAPRFSFKLSYNNQWDFGGTTGYDFPGYPWSSANVGPYWGCSWVSFLSATPGPLYGGPLFIMPDGGALEFTNSAFNGTVPDYYRNARLAATTNAGTITGYTITLPSGATYLYAPFAGLNWYNGDATYLLTQQTDQNGRTTTFMYNTNTGALESVLDPDGNTNTLTYTNVGYAPSRWTNEISQISDSYGHSVNFYYNSYGLLTNVTDAAGMWSEFAYSDSSGAEMTSMTTPYGNTGFDFSTLRSTNSDILYGYGIVTEANSNQQMFCYVETSHDFAGVPSLYTDTSNVPTSRPAENSSGYNMLDNPDWNNPGSNDMMEVSDSFYWNRQQFQNLSSLFRSSGATNWNFDYLSTNDYANGRLRHWNAFPDIHTDNLQGNGLSMEREPSPDGATAGKMIWWDYPNKANYHTQGNTAFPSLEIEVLPNGSNWYKMYQTDPWGNNTNVITTYSSGSTVLTRTNQYVYYPNGIDLMMAIGPNGETNGAFVTNWTYQYNGNHQVTNATDALGEVTTNTYNSLGQLTGVYLPTGLVTVYVYNGNNRLATTYDYAVVGGSTVYFRTNTFTYANDLLATKTDERGLTTTYSWDGLERLTEIAYPDSTSVSYTYSNLDLAMVVDRKHFTNTYSYNAIRQKVSQTDPNGNTTDYGYCECGSLSSITNAMHGVTQFSYDYQGNLTTVVYPDGYTVNNTYNTVRQLVTRSDAVATDTYQYNNQGLQTSASDGVGFLAQKTYDIDDRVTNSVDRNGLVVTNGYDNLNRTVIRGYPDNGAERYEYSPSGLIAYSNQLNYGTLYTYDAERRKIGETNANSPAGVTSYGYDPGNDLISLTDQNGNVTQWGYDIYGNVTSKTNGGTQVLSYQYDADNRLTQRTSAAKGSTTYGYDSNANLTSVSYPVSHSLSYSYDGLNRLASMSDGVGTTSFTYTPASQLSSETGPCSGDTVSNIYTDQLRTELSLGGWTESYAYDAAKRVHTITSAPGTFTYSYNTGLSGTDSPTLVEGITLPPGAHVTNWYDSNGRMLWTQLVNGTNLDYIGYTNNSANQRTSVVRGTISTSFVTYTYDPIGEVVSDLAYENGGATTRYNEQVKYGYDAAGNLFYRTNNGLVQQFNVNSLNELTSNTNGTTLTVVGTTTQPITSGSVTVNGTAAALYGDATFAASGLPISAGSYTAIATDSYGRHSTNTISVNLSTSVSFTYDGNGNLTSDGWRKFAYDDENQLIGVGVANEWSNQFVYDGKMRRRITTNLTWTGTWTPTNTIYYVYDGNLVLQERSSSSTPALTYTRGIDLSGTFEGAGGIGGLLASTTASGTSDFYHSDGNGNVTMLIDSRDNIVAKYLYDAFGNVLAKSGEMADANRYRFSSKEADPNSGLVYYLYRYYDPNLQRWPNRDPNSESLPASEINDYRFCINAAVNYSDMDGLTSSSGAPSQCNSTINCPSQWKNPPKWFPKKFACGIAKAACEASCDTLDPDCTIKCGADCLANFIKCGLSLIPKPPRPPTLPPPLPNPFPNPGKPPENNRL